MKWKKENKTKAEGDDGEQTDTSPEPPNQWSEVGDSLPPPLPPMHGQPQAPPPPPMTWSNILGILPE